MSEQIKLIISGNSKSAVTAARKTSNALGDFESKTGNIVGRIKKHWLGLSAAVIGVYATISQGWDLAEQSAAYEQSSQAFSSMVEKMGYDAEHQFQKIREASAGLIDNKSLVESANKAMSLGIPIEKLGELMEVARAKARDMGITTTQAFSDIAIGIGRGSPLIIDNLGIVLKLGVAYDDYASTLNKTSEELTTNEKKQALLNAVLDAGKEAVDRYDLSVKTTKERMEELTASFTNAKLVIGDFIIKIAVGLSGAWDIFVAAVQTTAARIVGPFAFIEKGLNKLGLSSTTFQDAFKDFTLAAEIYAKSAEDSFKSLFAEAEKADRAMGQMSGAEMIAEYESLYQELLPIHADAIDQMKSKSMELLQVEKDIRDTRMVTEDMVLSVKQKSMGAYEKYNSTIKNLRKKQGIAEALSGDEKISMLKSIQQQWVNTTGAVKENGQVVISAASTEYDALKAIKGIGEEITSMQETKKSAIEEEVDLWQRIKEDALDALESIQEKIGELPLDQKLELSVDDAMEKVDMLADKIMALSDIKPKVVVQAKVKSSPEQPFSEGIESMMDKLNALKTNAGFVFDFSKFSSMVSTYSNLQNRTFQNILKIGPVWDIRDYQQRYLPARRYIERESYAAKNFMEHYFKFMTDLIRALGKQLKASGPESVLKMGALDSLASGTSYVPTTGLYELHQGEAVIPANQNTYNSSSKQVNQFYITNPDPRAAAKEVAKILKNLKRYGKI